MEIGVLEIHVQKHIHTHRAWNGARAFKLFQIGYTKKVDFWVNDAKMKCKNDYKNTEYVYME